MLRIAGDADALTKSSALPLGPVAAAVVGFLKRAFGQRESPEGLPELPTDEQRIPYLVHDLRNALTVVASCVESLRSQVTSGAAEREFSELSLAVEQAMQLGQRLLTESDPPGPSGDSTDLNRVVFRASGRITRLAGRGITLQVRLAPQRLLVPVDPVSLERVLLNLVISARDAMPNGGMLGLETTVIRSGARGAATQARLTVRDSGSTFAVEHPSRSIARSTTSTRLGLLSVAGIVRGFNGGFHIESGPEGGTRAYVDLPLLPDTTRPRTRT